MTGHPLHFEKKNITSEEINALPLNSFKGEIVVVSDRKQLPSAFHEIAQHHAVGFDTETKPVFVRGHRNKVAIMQIALPHKVFLIRLLATGMTPEIIRFLQDPHIRKVGVAIHDDIKALQALHHFHPGGFEELILHTRKAGLEAESVKKLTALMLGFRISKSAQTSNWEAAVLDEKQISYAATDAWVCLEMFRLLQAD